MDLGWKAEEKGREQEGGKLFLFGRRAIIAHRMFVKLVVMFGDRDGRTRKGRWEQAWGLECLNSTCAIKQRISTRRRTGQVKEFLLSSYARKRGEDVCTRGDTGAGGSRTRELQGRMETARFQIWVT